MAGLAAGAVLAVWTLAAIFFALKVGAPEDEKEYDND